MRLRENIKFYTWEEFENIFKERDKEAITKDNMLSEIFWCIPLLLHQINTTNSKWLLGKVTEQKNSFDVFLAKEEEVRDGILEKPIAIQVKQIVDYPKNKIFSLAEWVEKVQKLINKKENLSLSPPQGIFYLANRLPINTFQHKDLIEEVRTLKIPLNFSYKRIIICFNLKTEKISKKSFVILEIYPNIEELGNMAIN